MAPKPTLEQSDIVETFIPGDKNIVINARAGCGKTSVLKMAARAVPKRKGLYIAYNKALRNDQPVLIPDGWRAIGEMEVGDLVIGVDGKPHSVTKVHPRGIRPMFEVVFSDGTVVVADEDHLWLTQTITYDARPVSPVKWRIRTTKAIADTVHQKHRVPHLQTPAKLNLRDDLPISPYLLGAIIGDGSFCNHSVLFACAEDDLVELVRAELPKGHTLNAQKDGGRNRSWLISGGRKGSRGSNKVMAALRELGLHGHRSGTKFVPPMYLYASAEQRLALLQGLMDTDGCASGVQSFFRTTSKRLADDAVFLAQSLGGVATIGAHENGSYLINVRLAVGICPFRLPRKVTEWRPRTRDEQTPRKIVEVREAAPAEATCISIDADDHLFLTAGCIPTHNSIQVEAAKSFPDSVTCKTSHGLAFGTVGRKYAHRLKAAHEVGERGPAADI